jgi:hypothetical protein
LQSYWEIKGLAVGAIRHYRLIGAYTESILLLRFLTQLFGLLNAGLHTRILNAELVLFCFSAATGT